MIGEFNRRVVVRKFAHQQEEGGGTNAVVTDSFSIWAKIENRSGNVVTEFSQQQWSYDYKVTFRYQDRIDSACKIDYENKRMTIQSLSIVQEGKKRFYVARCSALDIVSTNLANTEVQTLYYTGSGGETEFTATELIGKTLVGAFKDGIQYDVILTGLPTNKQVLFNSSTGKLTWAFAFDPNETSMIQYQ